MYFNNFFDFFLSLLRAILDFILNFSPGYLPLLPDRCKLIFEFFVYLERVYFSALFASQGQVQIVLIRIDDLSPSYIKQSIAWLWVDYLVVIFCLRAKYTPDDCWHLLLIVIKKVKFCQVNSGICLINYKLATVPNKVSILNDFLQESRRKLVSFLSINIDIDNSIIWFWIPSVTWFLLLPFNRHQQ
jgi:hypothetical protein